MTSRKEARRAGCVARRDEYVKILKPELERLAKELHNGEYAPSQSEYMLFAERTVDRTTIQYAFGKWEQAVVACGLKVGSAKYYWAVRNERQAEAALDTPTQYKIRDDEMLAATYRPPVKVRLEDKQKAEQLCEGIADDKQRLQVWFTALGYPEQVIQQWI